VSYIFPEAQFVRSFNTIIGGILFLLLFSSLLFAADFERDVIPTKAGPFVVTFIGHGTLMFQFGGKVIHVDPWSAVADYSELPRGDLVLLTHHHIDHLDSLALTLARKPYAKILGTWECARLYPGISVMRNGDAADTLGIHTEAVPAYNLRAPGRGQVHPKGACNGYILTAGGVRIYIMSETQNIPELKNIKDIDVAFIAMDGVFNMTPEEAAEAVKVFMPKVVYPYHTGAADVSAFARAMEGTGVEVRIRKMR